MSRALPQPHGLLDLFGSESKGTDQPSSSLACARSVSDLDQELSGLHFASLSVGRVDERRESSFAASGTEPGPDPTAGGGEARPAHSGLDTEPELGAESPQAPLDFPLPEGGPPQPGLSRVPLSSSDSIPVPVLEDEPSLELDYQSYGSPPEAAEETTADGPLVVDDEPGPAPMGEPEPLIGESSLDCSLAGEDGCDAIPEQRVARVTFTSKQSVQRSELDSSHARVSCSLLAQQSVWSMDVRECSRTLAQRARSQSRTFLYAGTGLFLAALLGTLSLLFI